MPIKNLSQPRLFSQKYGKSDNAAQCAKSRVLTKRIDTIIESDSFQKKCVILNGLLQSEQLKKHIEIIGVDQLISTSDLYEQRCLESVKNIYKQAGKCHD